MSISPAAVCRNPHGCKNRGSPTQFTEALRPSLQTYWEQTAEYTDILSLHLGKIDTHRLWEKSYYPCGKGDIWDSDLPLTWLEMMSLIKKSKSKFFWNFSAVIMGKWKKSPLRRICGLYQFVDWTWGERVEVLPEKLIIQPGSDYISYLSSARDQRAKAFCLSGKRIW